MSDMTPHVLQFISGPNLGGTNDPVTRRGYVKMACSSFCTQNVFCQMQTRHIFHVVDAPLGLKSSRSKRSGQIQRSSSGLGTNTQTALSEDHGLVAF